MSTNAHHLVRDLAWSLLLVAFVGFSTVSFAGAAGSQNDVTRKTVLVEKLVNVPGKQLTAIVVDVPPGARSAKHHHGGTVFVYVLSGALQVQFSGQKPRDYHAGEAFYEAPGTEHLYSRNLSKTKAVRLLAVFIADDGATLTTYDK